MKRLQSYALLLTLLAFLIPSAFAAATITIVNTDGPGEGFNDPTPAKPIGRNNGKTIGQQRLIAFQFAASIWAATLTDNVQIKIQSAFNPLPCTAGSGVLGSAGTIQIVSDFPGAAFPRTWYPVALGNKLANTDLIPGPSGTNADDIAAQFNSSVGGTNPDGTPCLTGLNWYYGLDDNHGTNIDLVTVLLHEFAHGLGFASFVDETNGTQIKNRTDIFSRQILDNSLGLTWDNMTAQQRKQSAINTRNVVWTGSHVTNSIPNVLQQGTPLLAVLTPLAIAANYQVGTASFGPPLSSPGVTGTIVQGLDPADTAGPSTTDGCSPLTNASAVGGNIALLDRGSCTFVTKVKNAQNAGAIGVIIVDNVLEIPAPGMSGTDNTITIPSVRISQPDGATIEGQLANKVTATLGLDLTIRAGADANGRGLLWTPNPVQPGSTISHWDEIATPDQLMEPAINDDLTHAVTPPQDLTFELLRDLGW
jgi:PA domain